MIIVTGATGHLGRLIVEQLSQRVSASEIGVSVRDPEKATDLQALGVRVRQGDFGQPESLAHAFEGVTQLLLVSSNARAYGGDTLAQHRAAIAAARDAGVQRIVYTSHMAVSPTSAFPPMPEHTETETMLQESGLAWTALRNGFYASSCRSLMGKALDSGVVATPQDGKVSWTTHEDLAEAAAIVLTQPGRYEGPTPDLVSHESFDLKDASELLGGSLRRQMRREVVEDAAFRDGLLQNSVPEYVADIALGFYIASRNGEFVSHDSTLEQLLGRRPQTLRNVFEDVSAPI